LADALRGWWCLRLCLRLWRVRRLWPLYACLPLAACGGSSGGAGAGAGAGAAGTEREKVLNVYSWTDYIAPDTVANFEKETGIKVRYDTYDSNEVLETKLLTGHTNYDIVVPTDTFFERLAQAGVFRALDPAALPNRGNLDPEIMQRLALHDAGNARAVPYLWSTVGLGYNAAAIAQRLGAKPSDGWSLLFDPANAAKLEDCGISIIDSPADVFAVALVYLGRDPNSREPADADAALAVLMKIRPYVRSIDTSEYISELANGSLCLALGWSGDVLQARDRAQEAANGGQIRYLLPREGSLLETDMMAIPADAPHPGNAEIWMNYLMRPEVMAGITNFVKYPNGNAASLKFVAPGIAADPNIYPDAAARAKLKALRAAPPEYSRLLTRLWTRFRTGS
jgi:putrescine transport system substrate-binding protein